MVSKSKGASLVSCSGLVSRRRRPLIISGPAVSKVVTVMLQVVVLGLCAMFTTQFELFPHATDNVAASSSASLSTAGSRLI